jgi:hypothetical protein
MSRIKMYFRAVVLLLCTAFIAPRLAAQTGNGVVQGTVLDATKASIPDAKRR